MIKMKCQGLFMTEIFLLNDSYDTVTSSSPSLLLMEEPDHLHLNNTSFREGLCFSAAISESSNLDLW